MNIASNPFSFVSTDVVTGTPIASPNGLILNADGTVTITTGVAFGVNANDSVTVISATNALYNGFYRILIGAAGTVFIALPQFAIPAGTAGSGGGTVAKCLYTAQVRIEDMSWQNPSAAGQLLDIRDRMGNILWQATATGAGSQNRGKVFWVNGFTPFTIQSGVVIVTVN